MDAWMKSDGHRRNILDGEFREIGVGTYTGTYGDTERVTMYTAGFGVRRGRGCWETWHCFSPPCS
jgi:uncharacterized protein YkwD